MNKSMKDYSFAFNEGGKACEDGFSIQSNPYGFAGALKTGWNDGFNDFLPIRNEWENSNDEKAKFYR